MQNNKFLKLINNAQSIKDKGIPNGYVPLDENGKIPVDFIPESEGIGSLDPSVTLENFKNWGEIPTDEEACLYANTINFPSLPNDIGGRNTYPYWIIISKIISGVSEEHWLLASLEKNINISFSSTYNRYDINNASRCYKLSSDKTKWSSISAITQINGSAYSITGSESNYYGNPYLLTPNKGGDGHIVIRQARGTATALDTYTGKEGELTVDTTNKTIRVQDGTTLGGIPLAKKEEIDTVDDKLQNHLDNHPSFKEFDYVDLGKVIIDDGTVISYYPNNYPEIPLDSGIAKDGQYPYWLIGEYGDGTVKLLGSESKITSGTYEDTFYCDSSSYVAYTLKDNQWTDKSISNRAIQPNGMKITKFVKETNFDFWCYPSMLHSPHILIHKKNATKKDLEDLHITFMLANITDHTKYLGSMGEVIVDINQKRLVLQDGVTKGGIPLAKKEEILDVERTTNKNQPNGYVGLDENGNINIDVIPPGVIDCIGMDWGTFDGDTKSYKPTKFPAIPQDAINKGCKQGGTFPYWFANSGRLIISNKPVCHVISGVWSDCLASLEGQCTIYVYRLNGSAWSYEKSATLETWNTSWMESVTESNYTFIRKNADGTTTIMCERTQPDHTESKDKIIQISRGTNVDKYTGKVGELVYDSDNKDLVIQDGITEGGFPLAKKSEVDNLSSRVDEVFQSVSNGKNLLARAITDKGINTLATDNFETMSNNIKNIKSVDIFKIYLGEEEPESPEEGCLWFPEIDANEKVNLAFTSTESHPQKDDGTILGTISLKEVDRFPLLNISNFMMVRMFNFKYFKDGFGIITPAYICNGGEWFCVYNFPPFDGTGIKYKIKIDNRYDDMSIDIDYKISMSNIVQAPIKNNYIINCKIKTECDIEAPVINLK